MPLHCKNTLLTLSLKGMIKISRGHLSVLISKVLCLAPGRINKCIPMGLVNVSFATNIEHSTSKTLPLENLLVIKIPSLPP